MPIIDGYDDLDLGPKKFPAGDHVAEIKAAKLKSGDTKTGGSYLALDIFVTDGTHGDNVRVFLPKTTQEWASWEDWQRRNCKQQLNGLGIHISEVESEHAREALINKTQHLHVNKNGDKVYVNFRETPSMDAPAGLPSPVVPSGGAVATTQPGQAIVV